jgi:hypothetical protein
MIATKKLTTMIIASLAILGVVFAAAPAYAGFFDWFASTPLNQEAQAVKSLSSSNVEEVKSSVRMVEQKKVTPVRAVEPIQENKSPAANFLQSIFSSRAEQVVPVKTVQPAPQVDDPRTFPATNPSVFKDNKPGADLNPRGIKSDSSSHYSTPSTQPVGIFEKASAPTKNYSSESSNFSEKNVTSLEVPVILPVGNMAPWYEQKLKKGDIGVAVQEMQKFLQQKGYLQGMADGVYGPGTARAVRLFQQDAVTSVGRQYLTSGNVWGAKTAQKAKEVLGVNSSRPNVSEDVSGSGEIDLPSQDTAPDTACDIGFRYAPWGGWVEFLTDSEMFELYRFELTNSSNVNCVITDFRFSFVYETENVFIEDLQFYNRDPFVYPASQKMFGQYGSASFSNLLVELGPGEVKEYSLYATVSNPSPGDEIGTRLDSVTANGIEFEVAPATQHLPYYYSN